MPGSKVIWHQKRGKSPVFRVWNQHFYNFPPSLWSEVQLTYIFVFSIIFWFLKVIGIGLHSRDFQTLKCCHSALMLEGLTEWHSEDTWVEMGSYLHIIYHLCSPVFILNSCQGGHRRNKHPCTKSKRYREGALNINHLSKMVDYRSMVDNIDPVATLHCGEYLSGFFFQN